VFGQLIYMNWDYQMVVVKLSSWPDFLNAKRLITTLKSLHVIGQKLSNL
jgi:CubicO group peptidase (beta-lactamase class C family)